MNEPKQEPSNPSPKALDLVEAFEEEVRETVRMFDGGTKAQYAEARAELVAARASLVARLSSMGEMERALEAAFFAMGRAGANADMNHPLRKDWEAARAALSSIKGGT